MYADNYQFTDDYKITLKTIPFEPNPSALSQTQQRTEDPMEITDNERIDMYPISSQYRRHQHSLAQTVHPLHTQQLVFYCLSPSVAFSRDLKLARS